MSRLRAEDLTVARNGRLALDHVSIELEPGRLTGLIGPNGAGKTTLLRCLAGLLRPDQGRVELDGQGLGHWPPGQRARRLAYLPQAEQVHWRIPVQDLVMLGRLPHRRGWGGPGKADRQAVARALAATGCAGLALRPANALSGGERARVLLARALAGDPSILLADEPIADLDPYHQMEVMEHLRSLARGGTTVLAVLHDLSAAIRFCDRLVLLDQGRIAAAGDPLAVTAAEHLATVFRIEVHQGRTDTGPFLVPQRRIPPRD